MLTSRDRHINVEPELLPVNNKALTTFSEYLRPELSGNEYNGLKNEDIFNAHII